MPRNILLLILSFALLTDARQRMNRAVSQTYRLQCEYWSEPLGIDVPQPRRAGLCYRAREESDNGVSKSLWHRRRPYSQDKGDLWDSGQVKSADTLGITYAGHPDHSADKQFFGKYGRENQDGKVLRWSANASWTTGVLEETDWYAKWIGSP